MAPSTPASASASTPVPNFRPKKPAPAEKEDSWDCILVEAGADLVLRSSDGVLHGVRSLQLQGASGVFERMLQDAIPGTEAKGSKRRKLTNLPLVELPEKSEALGVVLEMSDREHVEQAAARIRDDYGPKRIGRCLAVAEKYDFPHARQILGYELLGKVGTDSTSRWIDSTPVIFALASAYSFEPALRASLRAMRFGSPNRDTTVTASLSVQGTFHRLNRVIPHLGDVPLEDLTRIAPKHLVHFTRSVSRIYTPASVKLGLQSDSKGKSVSDDRATYTWFDAAQDLQL